MITRHDTARKAAQDYYGSDDVDIPDDSPVRVSPDGYWIQAHLWVSDADLAQYATQEGIDIPATEIPLTG